jgi:hypothetical protein
MRIVRLVHVVALVAPIWTAAGIATACPARGGGEVAVEPDFSPEEALLVRAAELEQSAAAEDSRARTAKEMARKQRIRAANLKEQARLFPELDGELLLVRAQAALREAQNADARALKHTTRAKTLRTRAAELRAQAKRLLLGTDGGSRFL